MKPVASSPSGVAGKGGNEAALCQGLLYCGVIKIESRKKLRGRSVMKRSGFFGAALGLFLAQSVSIATAADFQTSLQLAANDERYGCCLVKTNNKSENVWEYEDGITFMTCYKWAQLLGEPLPLFNNRKYEFYEGQRCSSLRDNKSDVIPAPWSPAYRNG